ncbi:MAG: hypothetical protein FWD19_01550, partial [Defluviitaleaceae bacterium]|nr:hypothetical protein [Defluviitaleaceae bacterium]
MEKFFIFFVTMIFFAGCATENPPQFTGSPLFQSGFLHETIAEEKTETGPSEYTVFFRAENNFAPYEPDEGAYIGAWLAPDAAIRVFEHQTEKRHAVFVNEINLDDEIPITWLLHCIASFTTPLFVVNPSEESEIPELELVARLAQRLGSFNLPMFVAFFPETSNFMPAEYTLIFRQARNIFSAHAPMVSFVWVAPEISSTQKNPYFPGENNLDWVAVKLFSRNGAAVSIEN